MKIQKKKDWHKQIIKTKPKNRFQQPNEIQCPSIQLYGLQLTSMSETRVGSAHKEEVRH